MRVIIGEDSQAIGELGADIIRTALADGALHTLGVATGSSPLPIYTALARERPAGLDEVEVFALDEYIGLPPDHPQAYRQIVQREIVQPLGLDRRRVHTPDVFTDDHDAAAAAYESSIVAAGGIDVQILGIGSNGHIGFNEPLSPLSSLTRVTTLSERTRSDNARFFDDDGDVPRTCITQGVGTILRARHLVLVALGAGKAPAIAAAVEGPVTAGCPASALQLHPRVTVLLDRDAAQELTHTASGESPRAELQGTPATTA